MAVTGVETPLVLLSLLLLKNFVSLPPDVGGEVVLVVLFFRLDLALLDRLLFPEDSLRVIFCPDTDTSLAACFPWEVFFHVVETGVNYCAIGEWT